MNYPYDYFANKTYKAIFKETCIFHMINIVYSYIYCLGNFNEHTYTYIFIIKTLNNSGLTYTEPLIGGFFY